MKVKNIIKRATSAIAAVALGITSLTSTLASAEAMNPNHAYSNKHKFLVYGRLCVKPSKIPFHRIICPA